MLQPELKFRRDKIRSLMVSQGIDAALITCNANLIYTYGCVVSGYLYLPLHSPALLFFKRPNNITGEHSFSIRKPEQIVDLLKEQGLPMPTKLMLEGDELPYTEYCRLAGLFPEAEVMVSQGIDAALITCNANLIYTYGCVVSGYLYLPLHSPALLFFKRPNNITGEHSFSIRKPEQIVDLLKEQGLPMPTKLMLEGDELPYTEYCRLAGLFPEAEVVNGTPLIRQARSVKTPVEIEMFRRSGIAHAKAYEQIPGVYRPGMTDIEFSIEIERLMRLQGCLGIFRVFGRSMEIFMGSVLTGDNAGYPSPYDFALGGQGLDPALPGGANKTPLKEGQSVMVDLGGNFNGYMNDMSRVFSIGKLPEEAYTAHQVCLDIQEKIASIARPGIACEVLYDTAVEVVKAAGFADKFMGTGQQAKFIGHGIGLEINEAPVLAPRIKQQLEPGMVFALEPKIVIPGVGPVGIENSWVVTNEGIEKLTNCNEEIIELS